ncbi:type III secretion protein HrpQ [Pseudomonas sp. 21LCFQ02]|uniref:FHA domain-containing protein n=1 Tax=unclassified Pseudomonas TaxID=196821 RepID=UPI0004F5BD27|nr:MULTISPECIES: FHA domain-containing protein [unclassified Pseudomonas]MCO8169109.1 type III secretion protein HrpQ [Pseudomonas sp. 21LCFQ02]BAP46062.1 type III secretion apparatus protein [Pseudomonas sp. StFLB209]
MQQRNLYELRVLTGLHRGAALPLSGDQWSIGSSSGSDLALYDPGIKDRHCLLRLVDDTWSLARDDGPVTDSEGHKVDAIERLEPGTPFALNGVWLSVTSANTDWPTEDEEQDAALFADSLLAAEPETRPLPASALPARRPLLGPLLLIGALLVFLGVVLWLFNQQPPLPPPVQTPHKTVLKDAAAVESVLHGMLRERELQDRISLSQEQGKILLNGRFDEDDLLQSASRLLLNFERQYKSPLPVLTALPSATDKLPFSIVQISNNRLPNVLTNTGRRMFLGDEVDGVRLVDISESKLVFEGERRVEVSW